MFLLELLFLVMRFLLLMLHPLEQHLQMFLLEEHLLLKKNPKNRVIRKKDNLKTSLRISLKINLITNLKNLAVSKIGCKDGCGKLKMELIQVGLLIEDVLQAILLEMYL
jgi:hypothetical protein